MFFNLNVIFCAMLPQLFMQGPLTRSANTYNSQEVYW
jgi:hypothetical protein